MKHFFFTALLACLLLNSCSNPVNSEPASATEVATEIEETVIFEEAAPDSGLLDNVNPEEIMTDDWSDEGDVELETE